MAHSCQYRHLEGKIRKYTFLLVFLLFPLACMARETQPVRTVTLPDTLQSKINKVANEHDLTALLDDGRRLVYNYPELAVLLCRQIIRLSQAMNSNIGSFKANNIIGVYHQNTGNFDSAGYYFLNAHAIAKKAGDQQMMAEAFNNLGVLNRRRGNYDSAYFYCSQALALALQIGDSLLMGNYYNNLGLIMTNQEKYDESLDSHFKALAIREKLGSKMELSGSYNNIALAYTNLKDHERALPFYENSLAIRKELGNKRQLAMGYLNIGACFYSLGQFDKSDEAHVKALDLSRELNDRQMTASIYDNMSYLSRKRGSMNESLEYAMKALEVFRDIGDNQGLMKLSTHASDILLALGRTQESMQYAREAYQLAMKEGSLFNKKQAAQQLAILHEDKGDYKNALKYFEVYVEKNDSLQLERYNNNITEVRERYEADKKEEQLKYQQASLKQQALVIQRNAIQRNFLIAVVLLVCVVMFLSVRVYRTKLQAKEIVNRKSLEFEAMRSNFFANISHEFRTPLTLIMGPVRQMLENKTFRKENLETILRNSERLERLISQLLDLSKFEAGKMSMELRTSDFHSFVRAVSFGFVTIAEKKNIRFERFIPENNLMVRFDHDKIEKILYNLLSNAFKFTPEDGHVTILVSHNPEGTCCIEISDSGKGIPESEHKNIFERFNRSWADGKYQYEGSGIGLALTKDLVELLGGAISVKSKPDEGASFIVYIPLTRDETYGTERPPSHSVVQNADALADDKGGINTATSSNPVILIVEDNSDLRRYIASCLVGKYNVVEAENGKLGLDKCIEIIPDVIISDLMMPEMDGMEFCRKIRETDATVHIPFIMLTARADDSSKITGLQFGADDYLVKPFIADEISIKVRNIIERRKVLQEKLRRQLLTQPNALDVLSADESFLLKLKGIIEDKMAEPELSVESLSREVALSRVQLYRKVLSLTGFSVNELIRSIRLQRAAQLMDKKWGTVSQIAYEVGFNNLSYFTKCFRAEYGKTPSEYLAKADKVKG